MDGEANDLAEGTTSWEDDLSDLVDSQGFLGWSNDTSPGSATVGDSREGSAPP